MNNKVYLIKRRQIYWIAPPHECIWLFKGNWEIVEIEKLFQTENFVKLKVLKISFSLLYLYYISNVHERNFICLNFLKDSGFYLPAVYFMAYWEILKRDSARGEHLQYFNLEWDFETGRDRSGALIFMTPRRDFPR